MDAGKSKIALLAVVVSLSAVSIYFPALKSDFLWDDLHLITHPLKMSENPYAFFLGGGVYYRPFVHLSMAVDYSFWHLNPFGYHLTNIVIHTINSLLVFVLGYHLFNNRALDDKDVTRKEGLKSVLFFSFIAAMLFALHPIHTESVAWISGRTDMLSTLFFILAFLSFLVYQKDGKTIALVLTAIFFLFSLFSKENAMALVGVVFVYGLVIKMPRKKLLISLLILIGVFITYLILRQGSGIREIVEAPGSKKAFFLPGLTTKDFFKILALGTGYYFEKLILPFNLNLLPSIPENPVYLMIFILPLIATGILYIAGYKIEGFTLTWIILTLSPSLLILFSQIAAPIGERYLYLPSAGFAILMGLLLRRIKNWKAVALIVTAVFTVYGLTTYERLKVWKSDATLWEDTVKKNPASITAHTNYGRALIAQKELDKARKELLFAKEMDNVSYKQATAIYDLLGVTEMKGGNYEMAESYFHEASRIDPDNATAFNNLGVLYLRKSESSSVTEAEKEKFLDEAAGYFKKAMSISPGFLQPKFNLGLCYMKRGEFGKAREYFNTVIESDPQSELSRNSVQLLMLIEIMEAKQPNKF